MSDTTLNIDPATADATTAPAAEPTTEPTIEAPATDPAPAEAEATLVAPVTLSLPVSSFVQDAAGRVGLIVSVSEAGNPVVAFLGDAVECVVPVTALA